MTFNQGLSDVKGVEQKWVQEGFRKHMVLHEIYRRKLKVVNNSGFFYFKLIIFVTNI
jgi:hypothetical protein